MGSIVGFVDGDGRVIVVERGAQSERTDRGPKAPSQMGEACDERRAERKIVRTNLLVILALIQRRIRERLAIRVYELVLLELFIGSSWDQIGELLGPKLGKHSQACSRQEQNDSGDNQKLASVSPDAQDEEEQAEPDDGAANDPRVFLQDSAAVGALVWDCSNLARCL